MTMKIQEKARGHFEFLKTTAIGGIFFLLPLIIIGTFLAKLAQFSVAGAKMVEGFVPLQAIGGYTMLLVAGTFILLGLCFAAGLIAKRSIAKRFTETLEKQLQIAFPRYAIVKDRLSGNIGGEHFRAELKTVLVHGLDGCYRLGLEVEKGTGDWVTVYFPGSPDPWSGQVAIVPIDKVKELEVDFIAAMTTLEKLGRQLQSVTKVSDLGPRS
jgi:uncharacterized membrane protein